MEVNIQALLRSSFVGFLATWFSIWLLRPLAVRIGFVDRPGGRKTHSDDIPLIGGVAMFFGFYFALLTLNIPLFSFRGMIAGSSLLLLIGVVDDFKGLSSRLRLFGQILAATLLIVWSGGLIKKLGNLLFLGNINLGLWSFPVTLVVIIGYINAMNMIDGQDGLAGGVAFGQVLLLLFLAIVLQRKVDVMLLLILLVLLFIFLLFNMQHPWRKKASIFMGDSGSTFIAFLIAWFAIDISQHDINLIKPMTVLWILAFPLFDLLRVIVDRLRNGRSPFLAGRDHFHHVIHLNGVNTNISTFLLCVLSLFFGLIGLILNYFALPEGWQFLGFLLALGVYFFLVRIVSDYSVRKSKEGE